MMSIQALHHDRGRILISHDTTPLQGPRRVNFVGREQREVDMRRCCCACVTLLVILALGPLPRLHADEKKAWQAAQLKKLEGTWTTVREEKTDNGKLRRRRIE